MNVIAFDPGKATGVALFVPNIRNHIQYDEHESFQLDNGFVGVSRFLTYGEGGSVRLETKYLDGNNDNALYRFDAVVCESFSVRQGTHKMDQGAFMDVWSNIGAIRYAAFLAGVPFHLQSPAEAKSFGTNDKLHALSWYKGAPGHADDASRHLLTFLAKQRDPEILERLTAP